MTATTEILEIDMGVPEAMLNRLAPRYGERFSLDLTRRLRVHLLPVLRQASPVRTGRLRGSWRIHYRASPAAIIVQCVFYGRFQESVRHALRASVGTAMQTAVTESIRRVARQINLALEGRSYGDLRLGQTGLQGVVDAGRPPGVKVRIFRAGRFTKLVSAPAARNRRSYHSQGLLGGIRDDFRPLIDLARLLYEILLAITREV